MKKLTRKSLIGKNYKPVHEWSSQKETYKVNGHTFSDYGNACEYIRTNNFRVTTTENIGNGVHLLNVVQVN